MIEPDVNGFKYDDFEHSADLVRAGGLVTRAAIPEIKKCSNRNRWLYRLHESSPSANPPPCSPIKVAPASADRDDRVDQMTMQIEDRTKRDRTGR
jgi:hypothetical protein